MHTAASDLHIAGLSTGYRGRTVIDGLTLDPIEAGRVTALVGPNAAGKTTLLRALAGLLPARGSAELRGSNLLDMTAAERAELVSYMPQTLPDRSSLTVLESVIAALRVTRRGEAIDGATARDRSVAVLDRLGIVDIALEPLAHLSGGQRQLCGLAQSLVCDPAVLLLDEPTSALDLRHQVTVMSMIRDLAANGKIVVCVLHDLSQAARWADAIVVLSGGRRRAQGTPDAAITKEMLADVYAVQADVDRANGYPLVIVHGSLSQFSGTDAQAT
jgi:iron complex transport system ATP-binding protein